MFDILEILWNILRVSRIIPSYFGATKLFMAKASKFHNLFGGRAAKSPGGDLAPIFHPARIRITCRALCFFLFIFLPSEQY